MRNFIDILTKSPQPNLLRELEESAPPGKKAERFIKKSKKDFKKRYGKNWEKVLYATAWKNFGESLETKGQTLEEGVVGKFYGWWITADGNLLDVSKYQHDQVAHDWLVENNMIEDFGKSEFAYHMAYTDYMEKIFGWIRVVNEQYYLTFQLAEHGAAMAAIKTANYMMEDMLDDRRIGFTLISDKEELERKDFPPFEVKKAQLFLRSQRKI